MKGIACMLVWIAGWCLLSTSCVETSSTAKDGTVTTYKGPAPGVMPFAAEVLKAYSPRRIDDAK